jgi:hypothetical protein
MDVVLNEADPLAEVGGHFSWFLGDLGGHLPRTRYQSPTLPYLALTARVLCLNQRESVLVALGLEPRPAVKAIASLAAIMSIPQ